MLTKYAEFEVLDVVAVPKNVGHKRLARIRREGHRHHFDYTPRPGFIYVRSRAISSRCNDNFDEFPAEEIKQSYRTFIGKPVFVNHHNADHRRARGVIIDAALHEDTNPDNTADTWAEVLMEVDAVRFPVLAREVLAGNIARTSMGTDVAYSVCTACGNKAVSPADYCQHIPRMKGLKVHRTLASGAKEQVLVAERCYGLGFFENSLLVEDPADPTAFVLGVDDGSGRTAARVATKAEVENEGEPIHRVASVQVRREDIERQEPRLYDVVRAEQRTAVNDHYNAEFDALVREARKEATYCPECNPSAQGMQGTALCHSHGFMQRERGSAVASLLQTEAYGETVAPTKVDTMRAENCPVCGDDEGFNGDKCSICGYTQPPSTFQDPDLTKAREMDLRQDQAEQGGVDPLAPDQQVAPEDDLECTNCGEVFSAEGDDDEQASATTEPTEEADPDDPDLADAEDPEVAEDDADPLKVEVEKPEADESKVKVEVEKDPLEGLDEASDEDIFEDKDPEDGIDENDADPATGEGRITSEPEAGHEHDDLGELSIEPNMTCPVCGQGTLVPKVPQTTGEPEMHEVGSGPVKAKERNALSSLSGPHRSSSSAGPRDRMSAVAGLRAAERVSVEGSPQGVRAGEGSDPSRASGGSRLGGRVQAQALHRADAPGGRATQGEHAASQGSQVRSDGRGRLLEGPPVHRGEHPAQDGRRQSLSNLSAGVPTSVRREATELTSAPGWGVQKETSTDMTQTPNQPNPAQQRRSQVIAAIREQQAEITGFKEREKRHVAQIGSLTQAVATLAVAAGVGNHPKFAKIVRSAGLQVRATDTNNSPEGAPATTTEQAKKPDATDDVENVGSAPGPASAGVTPDGVTDVNNSDVVANPPVLDNLQSATAPVSGTDAVTPAAGDAAGVQRVTVGDPSNEAFDKPGDSGWKNTSAKGSDVERFTASLRLARLRLQAGIDQGEDLALGQAIAASETPLGEINAQVQALASVTARQGQTPSQDPATRHLVPRSAAARMPQQGQGIQRSAPSLGATAVVTATTSTRDGEDEWMVGDVEG